MKKNFFSRITALCLLLISLVSAGCSTSVAPSQQSSNSPAPLLGKNSADLTKGRSYFMRECRTCHRAYTPEERTPDAWRSILARKSSMVSLTAAQYEKLTAYVMATSEAEHKKP